jgi:hypothetical protein
MVLEGLEPDALTSLHYQLQRSSSGSPRLVHIRILPQQGRVVCNGSYEPVPRMYESLGGPNKTSSQVGITNTPMLQ